jgi:hypothetical protein
LPPPFPGRHPELVEGSDSFLYSLDLTGSLRPCRDRFDKLRMTAGKKEEMGLKNHPLTPIREGNTPL